MASTCRAHRVQVRGFSSLAATRAIVKPGFGSVALSQSKHGELWIRIPSRSLGGTGVAEDRDKGEGLTHIYACGSPLGSVLGSQERTTKLA